MAEYEDDDLLAELTRANAKLALKDARISELEAEKAALTEERDRLEERVEQEIRLSRQIAEAAESQLSQEKAAQEAFAIRVLGQEQYDNSPCQAHPLELIEHFLSQERDKALEEDAARYRIWRSTLTDDNRKGDLVPGNHWLYHVMDARTEEQMDKIIDAAIDRALKSPKEKTK